MQKINETNSLPPFGKGTILESGRWSGIGRSRQRVADIPTLLEMSDMLGHLTFHGHNGETMQ